jgi:hypothetical protein
VPPQVLGEALKLVERARKLAPENAAFVAEQGYQQVHRSSKPTY